MQAFYILFFFCQQISSSFLSFSIQMMIDVKYNGWNFREEKYQTKYEW